jgi:multiple sugar transport system ATP-binding protein
MYDHPSNLFVAGFIGSPAMNMSEATVTTDDGAVWVEFAGYRLRVPDATLDARPRLREYEGRKVVLGIRPEDFEDPEFVSSPSRDALVRIVTDIREAMGSEVYLHFTVDAPPVLTDDTRDLAADTGQLDDFQEQVAERTTSFVARLNPRTRAVRGAALDLHVDVRGLHFFDRDDGNAIV